MNKAEYKALREAVGLSNACLARQIGATENSVKRWENPRYSDPPEAVCDMLRDMRSRQLNIIEYAVKQAEESGAKTIRLNYYRTQADYDFFGRDKGDYAQANANARAVATTLELMGYTIEYYYPGDYEWTETPPNPEK